MGFANKIKGAYFFFEDKWYSVLDKINKTITELAKGFGIKLEFKEEKVKEKKEVKKE